MPPTRDSLSRNSLDETSFGQAFFVSPTIIVALPRLPSSPSKLSESPQCA